MVDQGCVCLGWHFLSMTAHLGCWAAPLACLLGWSSVRSLGWHTRSKHCEGVELVGYMDTDLICHDFFWTIEATPPPTQGQVYHFLTPTM